MMLTIAERVHRSAVQGFIGRAVELHALVAAAQAEEPPFLVALVHGPGGIGKTRLVRQLIWLLPPSVHGVYVDGRDVEPTPEGFCRAVGQAIGGLEGRPTVAELAAAIGRRRTVLAVDTYESLGLLDAWLRTRLLPALPATTLTLLAGRDRPSLAWQTAAGWADLAAEFPVTGFSDEEAMTLLKARGLDIAQSRWANGVAHGHPLALELAAAAVRRDASCSERAAVAPAGLLETFLRGLPLEVVEVVEAASTVRRVTGPLLAAVLGDERDRFATLRALPFVDEADDGLLLHDVVRDAVNHDLSVRDPDRRREYRRRAVRFLAEPERSATDRWRRTADLMFLIENPVVRDACFPSARPSHYVEPACAGDRTVVQEITRRHESPNAAATLERWWERHPESFLVAKDPSGSVAAFVQIVQLSAVDPELEAVDPVLAAWRRHLLEVPPGRDDDILVMRRWLGHTCGELRSPGVSACWLDVKRVYMQLRPRLRRIYSVVADLPRLAPIFAPLGFAPTGDPVSVGDATFQPVWLDFGPGSVDGWLAGLVGSETAGPAPAGSVPGLSGRELEVLRLVSSGRTNREIGDLLFMSEKTASRHLSNVFDKLGVRSRTEAARVAAEHGLT